MRLRKAPKFFVDDKGAATNKKVVPKISTVQVEREFIPIDYYESDTALFMDGAKGYTMIFDIESYINYFLIGFKCIETGKYVIFEDSPDASIDLDKLNWLLWNFRLVGFNSSKYDIIMTMLALRGYKAERLKECTRKIIPLNEEDRVDTVQLLNDFNLKIPTGIDHIDLISVCPLKGSLKKRAARLHAKRLQELPYHFDKVLTKIESEYVKNYCLGSDIVATELIFDNLSEQLKLRYDLSDKYGLDLRSKSDAQIAEAVINSEIKKITGKRPMAPSIPVGTTYKYTTPDWLEMKSDAAKEVLNLVKSLDFVINENGVITTPEALAKFNLTIGKATYRMGVGGLHSTEESIAHTRLDNG